ncbi:MAG TPA: carboxypeptidase M32 [Thermoprotei archaeon]|nr:carboxypeptidase M32 [Thermoprotei archaeon]
MDIFENPRIKEILDKYRVIWALHHAQGLLSWDTETNMPIKGVEERSIAIAELAGLARRLLLKEDFLKLLDEASQTEDLNIYERGVVRVLNRAVRIYRALPEWLVMEMAKITEEAKVVWRKAKEKDDFNMFKPYLEKIVDLNRKAADYLGYEEHPYDALLDLYEEGFKTRDADKMFDTLEPGLKKIFDKVYGEKLYPSEHELEKVKYDPEDMKKVNLEILNIFGYPKDKARLDISAHPFTIELGINDVRITTRYEGFDFKRSLFSTIHEFGHALYALQVDERFKATPLAGGASLGIHESQSRFWENIIGRSREFTAAVYPILKKYLPFIEKYTSEDLYYYFNTVKPSFIRTEADEVTYNFHILLRYRLEKMMIERSINVSDVPEYWNNMMEDLLGIRPKKYSEGVLQDIHWSMGNIGYFPTYTIGNIISGQIKYHIEREIPDFRDKISKLEFTDIKEYLREKIHRWGSVYKPQDLLQESFKEGMDTRYFIRYLEEKYLS